MGSAQEQNDWVTIPPKGRKGRQRLARILAEEARVNEQNGSPSSPTFSSPPRARPSSFLDVVSIAADHSKLCSKWLASPSYSALRAILADNAASHAPITTAVCLGVGSFDVADQSARYCRASHDAHVQLEAFRAVVGVLEEKSGRKIKCYAQEPSFGPSDREFCRSLGIEVLDTPDGFRHVDSSALVFGVHLPHVAWGCALKDGLPGLYIGTDLKSLDDLNTHLRDDQALVEMINRVREMQVLADRYVFPLGDRHTQLESTFSSTDILWTRKPVAGEPGGDRE